MTEADAFSRGDGKPSPFLGLSQVMTEADAFSRGDGKPSPFLGLSQ